MADHDRKITCSFCGKNRTEVRKIILGPGVTICNECMGICNEILAEEKEEEIKALQVKEKVVKTQFDQPASHELIQFTKLFALLAEAHVPLITSLEILLVDKNLGEMSKTVLSMADALSKGKDITEALSMHPDVFDDLYVQIVEFGNHQAILDMSLWQLARFLAKERQLSEKYWSTKNPVLQRKIAIARVSGILAFCLEHDIPIMKAFEIAATKIPDLKIILEKVKSENRSLVDVMTKDDIYSIIGPFISLGEQKNNLAQLLHQISILYDEELGIA